MAQDPNFYFVIGSFSLAAIIVVSYVSLRGWREWIALKHAELDHKQPDAAIPSATSRIEVADLKERVKKLEAIAAGIDL
ncbi:hypothetical protein ACFOWX_05975 [Sphingorhabdus arenilitoris]|uniref:Uncharacterized protein n=1 Tax=Sphingorhabdus arenilitoris TaxID=1490041 RepID=A0ABV8RH25_9SPHN